MKLLLIEDSDAVRSRLLEALPTGERLKVTEAATVAEAMEALRHAHDIVSVDLRLPDGHGLDVISHARKTWPASRIYVLTSSHGAADRCLATGADRVFDKSTDLTLYLDTIERDCAAGRGEE